jgi:hypothetical protein
MTNAGEFNPHGGLQRKCVEERGETRVSRNSISTAGFTGKDEGKGNCSKEQYSMTPILNPGGTLTTHIDWILPDRKGKTLVHDRRSPSQPMGADF